MNRLWVEHLQRTAQSRPVSENELSRHWLVRLVGVRRRYYKMVCELHVIPFCTSISQLKSDRPLKGRISDHGWNSALLSYIGGAAI
jgi:hypothetical protein